MLQSVLQPMSDSDMLPSHPPLQLELGISVNSSREQQPADETKYSDKDNCSAISIVRVQDGSSSTPTSQNAPNALITNPINTRVPQEETHTPRLSRTTVACIRTNPFHQCTPSSRSKALLNKLKRTNKQLLALRTTTHAEIRSLADRVTQLEEEMRGMVEAYDELAEWAREEVEERKRIDERSKAQRMQIDSLRAMTDHLFEQIQSWGMSIGDVVEARI